MVRSYCGEEQLDAAQIAYGALSLPPEGSGGEDIPAETAWTASGNPNLCAQDRTRGFQCPPFPLFWPENWLRPLSALELW